MADDLSDKGLQGRPSESKVNGQNTPSLDSLNQPKKASDPPLEKQPEPMIPKTDNQPIKPPSKPTIGQVADQLFSDDEEDKDGNGGEF